MVNSSGRVIVRDAKSAEVGVSDKARVEVEASVGALNW